MSTPIARAIEAQIALITERLATVATHMAEAFVDEVIYQEVAQKLYALRPPRCLDHEELLVCPRCVTARCPTHDRQLICPACIGTKGGRAMTPRRLQSLRTRGIGNAQPHNPD